MSEQITDAVTEEVFLPYVEHDVQEDEPIVEAPNDAA